MNFNLFSLIKKKDTKKNIELKNSTEFGADEESSSIVNVGDNHVYGYSNDNMSALEIVVNNLKESIIQYRSAALVSDVDFAIDEIVNDALVKDGKKYIDSIDLDDTDFSDNIKKKIIEEFENIVKILRFNKKAPEYFKKWYTDGRLIVQKIFDKNKPNEGIKKIKIMNPLEIIPVEYNDRKMFAYMKWQTLSSNIFKWVESKNKDRFIEKNKITLYPEEMITYIDSGLFLGSYNFPVSYLHTSLKRVNQLRLIEDSIVIYRIQRAPERRVFYIDVGNMPTTKAKAYIKNMMREFKNERIYNTLTGEINNKKATISMEKDYWLPRKEGKNTEVSTLPGGSNLGEVEDLQYFEKKLYQSLRIPAGRMDIENQYSIGRSQEITREEVRFSKHIDKLRAQFSMMLISVLKTQVILKKIVTEEEWLINEDNIYVNFNNDNYYATLKKFEILNTKVDVLNNISDYIGEYFTKEFVYKEIFNMTDDEIKELKDKIEKESQEEPVEGNEEDEE